MDIQESEEFKKDFKKLLKKYKTLQDDFSVAKSVIVAEPKGDGTKHWNILWQSDDRCILKVRMMCRAVKGASFRLIYFYDGEVAKILFIEMYYKGSKELEDRGRISAVVKQLQENPDTRRKHSKN